MDEGEKKEAEDSLRKDENSLNDEDLKSDDAVSGEEALIDGEGEDSSDDKHEDSINDNHPKDNKDIEGIHGNQLKWMMFLMGGVVLLILVIPFVFQNFVNTFDYHGLQFHKTKLGDINFYSTRFPVVTGTGQSIGTYSVNLRKDPRDLENVYVNVSDGKIKFALDKGKFGPAYISLNPFMEMCDDSVISFAALSGFLKDSGLEVRSAYTDKAYAKQKGVEQWWCHNDGFDTVIVVTDGDETSIKEIAPNCYELKFNNCEVLDVSERFMLIILEEYANRFKEKSNFN